MTSRILKKPPSLLFLSGIITISAFVTGCSTTSVEDNSSLLHSGNDIMAGPGIFTGEKGAFYVVGGKKEGQNKTTVSNVTQTPSSKPVSKMSNEETSILLDKKIKQLQRDQIELELLKRQLNNKLKN